jgi:hypothetical protein
MQKLFTHLELCRLEKSVLHFSEKQYSYGVNYSGIMIDYDLIVREKLAPTITDKQYFKISQVVMRHLIMDLNLSLSLLKKGFTQNDFLETNSEFKLHICFIIKENTAEIPTTAARASDERLYKYGFHILIPNIMVKKEYKRYLFQKLKDDKLINNILLELGVVNNPISECLDQNSASVPVLFLGSCKRTGRPYNIGSFLEITVDLPYDSFNTPVIKKLTEQDLEPYNLVAELSLTLEADYNTADSEKCQSPLIIKRPYDVNTELEQNLTLAVNTVPDIPNDEQIFEEVNVGEV